jgi:hypothetical protein
MKFPRCYLVIDEAFQLPSLETLRKWCQSDEAVYVEGISEFDDDLHMQTVDLLAIHNLIDGSKDKELKLVIFHGNKVDSIMLLAISGHYKKVYWVDSQSHLDEIFSFVEGIEQLDVMDWACSRADEAFKYLSNLIKEKTGNSLSGDDAYWQKVNAIRYWGEKSEAELMMKSIAKTLTRAGVLIRFDLEGQTAEVHDAAV